MDEEISDRRTFFKSLLGKGLTRGVEHVDARLAPVQRSLRLVTEGEPEPEPKQRAAEPAWRADAPPGDAPVRLARPRPASATCTMEELMRLAAENGLSRRVEAVCALARQSLRLVPVGEPDDGDDEPVEEGLAPVVPLVQASGRSRLGGSPDLPDDLAWPDRDGLPLDFIAQIDLAEAAAAGLTGPLPSEGLLCFFADVDNVPSRLRPQDAGCGVVVHVPDGSGGEGGQPLALSVELSLPRVWTARVRALELDAEEQDGWKRVRELIAERQGVDLEDVVREDHAIHRLLGYPDERRGLMPIACELADRGIDPGESSAIAHPRARELEPDALRWQLLLQVTLDATFGAEWANARERLYVWVDGERLAAGDLSRVWTIAQ